MKNSRYNFPFKIIISYIVISILAVAVANVLFMEFRTLTRSSHQENRVRFVDAGSFINYVYEVDSYSRITLLPSADSDHDRYKEKIDCLYKQIGQLKQLTQNQQ